MIRCQKHDCEYVLIDCENPNVTGYKGFCPLCAEGERLGIEFPKLVKFKSESEETNSLLRKILFELEKLSKANIYQVPPPPPVPPKPRSSTGFGF